VTAATLDLAGKRVYVAGHKGMAVAPGYNGIAYMFYLIGPAAIAKQRAMPPCVPGTLPLRALPRPGTAH
jgi:hypothetical protein